LIFPKEADEGLWGGEGLIAGLRCRGLRIAPVHVPRMWKSKLMSRVFYSEILDKWMEIVVTTRTLDLIDEAHGFDMYILKTHEVDLKSRLGMRLKRDMLLALARRSIYPNDPIKRDAICDKYREFVITEEESEWVGLSLYEAEQKQHDVEEEERKKSTRPLKVDLFDSLSAKLSKITLTENEMADPSVSSWIKKLSPFQDKQNKD